ncbi:hypothetical protein niasHS_003996 [Heterodera schachtii]|uniref:Cytochrome b-c1 complex subunit 8 n=1 Tax=Heterodera schachtii TaxID=97005 RepID=A0ABD2K3U3_HETSC
MRLSLLRASEKHFGNLSKAYGWYYVRIAPVEQKVWKGFFFDAFVKPVKEQLPHWWMFFFPVVTYFLVTDWAKKEYRRLGRIKEFTDEE